MVEVKGGRMAFETALLTLAALVFHRHALDLATSSQDRFHAAFLTAEAIVLLRKLDRTMGLTFLDHRAPELRLGIFINAQC